MNVIKKIEFDLVPDNFMGIDRACITLSVQTNNDTNKVTKIIDLSANDFKSMFNNYIDIMKSEIENFMVKGE